MLLYYNEHKLRLTTPVELRRVLKVFVITFFGFDSKNEFMYAHTMKITGKKTTNAPRIHSHGYKSHSPHDGSQAIMRPFHLLHHFIADALEVKTT